MADTTKLPLFSRVSTALAVLRGTAVSQGDQQKPTRAITQLTLPGSVVGTPASGMAGLSLVRTANPQEYKPDGATIRNLGFSKHPVVHACIRVIADIVAAVPFVVLREKGDYESRVGDDHPLQRLLDYPAPRMTSRGMRARLAVDYLGYGNALFQMERPAPGRLPVALRSINPESLQSVWVDAEGDPRRYDYGNWAGVIVEVPVEDVLHFRDLDMPRPFAPDVFGFPRGATAIASMTADNEATTYVRQVVTNDGTPTFAVLLSDEATQDDATAMQDRYRARVVDRGKRGTPAFFGAVRDIKPLGFTLRDLEFPDLRRVSREDICAAYGVDPRMIGIASATSDAGLSGAQYVEARARLVQHTIEPMLVAIEDELNLWLAPEYGDVWVTFDHDVMRDLVENDAATSTRVQAEFKLGLRTWEESRRALKLSPLPEPTDTIALTTGTQLVPAAVAVIDPRAIADQPPATDSEGPQDGPGPMASEAEIGAIDAGETDRSERAIRVRAMADQALSGDQIEQLIELLESISEGELPAEAVEAVILAAYPKFDPDLVAQMVAAMLEFEPEEEEEPEEKPEAPEGEMPEDVNEPEDEGEDEDERGWWERMTPEELAADSRFQLWQRAVLELDASESAFYEKAIDRFDAERADMPQQFGLTERAYKTTDEILAEIDRRIRENYKPGGSYYEAWRTAFLDLIGQMYMVGAQQIGGVGLSFTLQTPQVQRAILARAAKLADYVGQTTAEQITAAIRASRLGGLSVAETAKLVQAAVFNERVTTNRAKTIARTESGNAWSNGNWDQAQDMGIYRSKEWLAFEDNKTRTTHRQAMRAGVIPIDAKFPNGLLYPHDPAGGAREVINCRCVLAYYVTEAGEERI